MLASVLVALVVLVLAISTGPLLRWAIKKRLRGYVRIEVEPDTSLPEKLTTPRTVAILGAGVAGLTAAVTLARRGYRVTLIEKNEYLGGKLGSWPVTLADGRQIWVSHGFHAFFPHYYNLNRFLDSLSLRSDFASIGDYVIVGKNSETLRFRGLDETPVFNLVSLMRKGMFSAGDALRAPGRDLYGVFLEYEQAKTFSRFDSISYAEFVEVAQVPPRLRLAFNTFARAFFAEEDRLSFAELVKSFHFYYLSHDGGLVYDFPVQDYEPAFLSPLRQHLEGHGAELRLGVSVQSLSQRDGTFLVDAEPFDKVILATDVVGARTIMKEVGDLTDEHRRRFEALTAGQRYAVYRVWFDKNPREGLPMFVITERQRVLDSVTFYHRFETQTQADVADRRKSGVPVESVLELHCYSVPDGLPDDEVRGALLDELFVHFPEMTGARILDEYFQLRADFTAFHVGMHEDRPTTDTGISGLYCAGDWVKLPFPAMLLEGACASGLVAANRILAEDGLRQELVLSVPLQGLMAGMRSPPGREQALGRLRSRV